MFKKNQSFRFISNVLKKNSFRNLTKPTKHKLGIRFIDIVQVYFLRYSIEGFLCKYSAQLNVKSSSKVSMSKMSPTQNSSMRYLIKHIFNDIIDTKITHLQELGINVFLLLFQRSYNTKNLRINLGLTTEVVERIKSKLYSEWNKYDE